MRSFDDMNRMFSEMDRMFDQMRSAWWGEFGASGMPTRPALEARRGEDASIAPVRGFESGFRGDAALSLEEEGDEYVFVMDLPGFEKEDVDLTYEDGTLSIRALRDVEEGTDGYRAMRSRRVARQVPIPKEVVTEEIAASYRNGVLEVHLPIVEADREDGGHRIDIE